MEEKKKLYRSSKEKILCGVCGGLSEYFKIDVSLVRIAWIIASCVAGVGLLAYIIAAIVVPSKE